MMPRPLALSLFFATLAACAGGPTEPQPIQLWNGSDLTGWHVDVPAADGGDLIRPAVLSQLATAAVLMVDVRAGEQSIIAARRDRKI